MDYILEGYSVNEPTWFYLSLLLTIAVFFRFNRLWSLRNLDLILLLSVSPALLLINSSPQEPETPQAKQSAAGQIEFEPDQNRDPAADSDDGTQTDEASESPADGGSDTSQPTDWRPTGNIWLIVCTGLFLLRLFCDPWFKRRPLLEQNLNAAGLTFLCVAAFAFQVTKVLAEPPAESTMASVHQANDMLKRRDTSKDEPRHEAENEVPGPAAKLMATTALAPARVLAEPDFVELFAARLISCVSHLAVVLGLVFLGRKHLGDIRLGVSMATLSLLLPCTAYQVSRIDHILPAALVIWALVFYHRPMTAGVLMGLACGTVFFTAFLLPLWVVFYGKRGSLRFGVALAAVATALISTFMLTASDSQSFLRQSFGSINWSLMQFQRLPGEGFWAGIDPAYRLPVIAAFTVMVICLTIFPLKKNIEHLMAHSAAIVVATQLWYPQSGSNYVLWYLPLMLAVTFRPRLTHLVPPEAAPLLRTARTAQEKARKERTFTSAGRQKLR